MFLRLIFVIFMKEREKKTPQFLSLQDFVGLQKSSNSSVIWVFFFSANELSKQRKLTLVS